MRRKSFLKKLKNPVIMTAGTLVIIFIIFSPVLYFRQADARRYHTRHSMEKISFKLDMDVENVLMVNRLHYILNSPYQLEFSYDEETLVSNKISLMATDDYERISINKGKNGGVLILYYDELTDKVIKAKHKKKNYNRRKYVRKLCTEKGDAQMQEELNQFLEYLGLNVIDDWYYYSVWDGYNRENEAWEAYTQGETEWYMSSSSAKLTLYAKPEKDGVKYYFKVKHMGKS